MKSIFVPMLLVGFAFTHACLTDKTVPSTERSTFHTTLAPEPVLDSVATLRNRLAEAIATHPDAKVRDDLFPLIISGEIATAWAKDNNGQFGLLRPNNGGNLIPFLAINPELLRDKKLGLELTLTIFHEYIHYLQWSQGRTPDETFIHQLENDVKNPNEWCEQKWYAEMEAYQKECEFAHRIGARQVMRICTATGELDREQLKSLMMRQETNVALCKKVWKNL